MAARSRPPRLLRCLGSGTGHECLFENVPAVSREAQAREEPRLEPPDRVAEGQETVFELGAVDEGVLGVRQQHAAFYRRLELAVLSRVPNVV